MRRCNSDSVHTTYNNYHILIRGLIGGLLDEQIKTNKLVCWPERSTFKRYSLYLLETGIVLALGLSDGQRSVLLRRRVLRRPGAAAAAALLLQRRLERDGVELGLLRRDLVYPTGVDGGIRLGHAEHVRILVQVLEVDFVTVVVFVFCKKISSQRNSSRWHGFGIQNKTFGCCASTRRITQLGVNRAWILIRLLNAPN